MPLKLVYWGFHGRAAEIKILLNYLKVDFEEKNPTSPEEYVQFATEDKVAIPNLPYIVDGDFSMTESGAIPYYIANK